MPVSSSSSSIFPCFESFNTSLLLLLLLLLSDHLRISYAQPQYYDITAWKNNVDNEEGPETLDSAYDHFDSGQFDIGNGPYYYIVSKNGGVSNGFNSIPNNLEGYYVCLKDDSTQSGFRLTFSGPTKPSSFGGSFFAVNSAMQFVPTHRVYLVTDSGFNVVATPVDIVVSTWSRLP
eukprot:TRINITY_DN2664_c0_g1_i1.p1 TRINITY_DN2664_c0_g1~~TRINITY_DN2664_c0_g1_i1.p1  ORF type:complete len:176 (+),score=35.91 TRINITY_DN2664_c0_g1_i1:56-583(+)